ncbi:M23 family metallopeptidase [Lysobacter sp. GX 14042]|uniref:M23 family metallopeptidase n=1 Tax=Lysobacter sp. GX 14042 TaxID=2907155 RepID=UPI001F34C798|nr:M23 family metallopeptidase [Lysobacter sp. GX 14042]MCE7031825.1 M23 family metallopeptidase [Lysobacter sp. GX 14042]
MAARRPRPAASRLLSALAGLLRTALVLGALAGAGWWAWQQPFMERPRTLWELSRAGPAQALPVPVMGVSPGAIADTWGAGRSGGRRHEGVDIFAARGTPVVSSTRGIVSAIRETGLGGRQVWVLGPGLERYYYAHLDDWADGLQEGDVVRPGQALGVVGDTGNARGTPTHLHYGIYGADGALDPLPRLRAGAP